MRTVLIIEDDKNISYALTALLESEGYATLSAENGSGALELLQNHEMPHLILLDMIMPGMNGWEFAKEFFSRYENRAPIIVMTAAADVEQRAQDVRAIGWIMKPFSPDVLISLIKKHATAQG